MKIERFYPCMGICRETLMAAQGFYEQTYGTKPRALLCNPDVLEMVYQIYAEVPSLTRLMVIAVPGSSYGWWAVIGPEMLLLGSDADLGDEWLDQISRRGMPSKRGER